MDCFPGKKNEQPVKVMSEASISVSIGDGATASFGLTVGCLRVQSGRLPLTSFVQFQNAGISYQ